MLCSPEQIEAKRRKALEKLQAKLSNSNINSKKTTSISYQNVLSIPKSVPFLKKSSPSTISSINNIYQNKPVITKLFTNTTSSPKTVPSLSSSTTSLQNNAYQKKSAIIESINNESISNKNKTATTFSPYAKNKSKQTPALEKKTEFCKLLSSPILGSTSLITDRRFTLKMDKYSEVVYNICKKMSTKKWDPSTKLWTFDVCEYDILMNQMKLLRPDIAIDTIPACVINLTKANAKQDKNIMKQIDLSTIDSELLNSLMQFQLDGVHFGIQKRGRCLIADEMGLGKTFQALALACYYRNDWPMLIVTTSSTRNSWQETIQTYLPSVPLYYVTHMSTSKDYINDSKILILTHDLMTRSIDKLLKIEFRTLIIDESHTIKNFKSKCTKAAYRLSKQAKRVILLSGTPALSRPSELYTQIQLIDDTFFKDFREYSLRYCDAHESKFGWEANGQSNLQELEIILNLKFMIRRTKDQVLPLLPSKTRELIILNKELIDHSATDADKKCLSTLRRNFKQTADNNSYDKSLLLTYFNQTAKLKQHAVCSYLIDELKKDINCNKKFLIFAHHKLMLHSICEIFDKNNISYIRIDGKTTIAQRTFFVNKFNTSDQCRCGVLSTLATNAGITLTAASLVIFAELHWNPSILVQAEGRAHRIGQENNVQVRYLIANNTADDEMWNMIKSKTSVLNAAGLSKDSFDDAIIKEQETLLPNTIIDQFFQKLSASPTKANVDNIENIPVNNVQITDDDNLIDFINDEDDDLLASVQI